MIGQPLLPIMRTANQDGISINGFMSPYIFDGNWDNRVFTTESYPTFTITFPTPKKFVGIQYKGQDMGFSQIQVGVSPSSLTRVDIASQTSDDKTGINTVTIKDPKPFTVIQVVLSSVGSSPKWSGYINELQIYGESSGMFIEVEGKLYTVKNKTFTPIGDVSSITLAQYKSPDIYMSDVPNVKISYNGKDVPLLQYLKDNYEKFKIHTLK